ncbi:hypothetical protein N656DRAFT_361197 [Canariomyces notabilis]|uniref:Uncharacterized protein n=1 Tax=Canariomyces notabilis TaxID=2074819 RepID=A0AAN6T9F3_9PEZI|nr:hypothetical protein N656DRAFT_361197 [Canariomyces arenarius]
MSEGGYNALIPTGVKFGVPSIPTFSTSSLPPTTILNISSVQQNCYMLRIALPPAKTTYSTSIASPPTMKCHLAARILSASGSSSVSRLQRPEALVRHYPAHRPSQVHPGHTGALRGHLFRHQQHDCPSEHERLGEQPSIHRRSRGHRKITSPDIHHPDGHIWR